MKKTTNPKRRNPFFSFFCSLFGHHYVISKKVTQHIKEYKCVHCQKQVTTDVEGHLSALTPQMQEINDALKEMYHRRQTRVVHQSVA